MSSIKNHKSLFVPVALLAVLVAVAFFALDTQPQSAIAAGKPSVNLDQCRNGGLGEPMGVDCEDVGGPRGWENGNSGPAHAHFAESLSIPYRLVMEELPVVTGGGCGDAGDEIVLTLAWDIKHGGKNALDYMTDYQNLDPHMLTFGHAGETVVPVDGVFALPGVEDKFPLPAPINNKDVDGDMEPLKSFTALGPALTKMSLFGPIGSVPEICGVAHGVQGDIDGANESSEMIVTFVVTDPTAVMAWGGHIAAQMDWGSGESASSISGSPYHTRTIDWNLGNLGQQDRSLKSSAVVAPATIIIVKVTEPESDQAFSFNVTDSGMVDVDFMLDDDGDPGVNLSDTETIGGLPAGVYVATEAPDDDYDLTNINCTARGVVVDLDNRKVTITIGEGETNTCTFTNQILPKLKLVKHVVPTNGDDGLFDLSDDVVGLMVDNGVHDSASEFVTTSTGSHTVSEAGETGTDLTNYDSRVDCGTAGSTGSGTSLGIVLNYGDEITCTFTNSRLPRLTLAKVAPDGGLFNLLDGANQKATNIGTHSVGPFNTTTGPHTVSETEGDDTKLANYESSVECGGAPVASTQIAITLNYGDNVTCTFTNTELHTLTVLVCHQNSGTFVNGGVVPSGGNLGGNKTTMNTLNDIQLTAATFADILGVGATFQDLENNAGIDLAELEAFLCSLREGATYTDLTGDNTTYKPDTTIDP